MKKIIIGIVICVVIEFVFLGSLICYKKFAGDIYKKISETFHIDSIQNDEMIDEIEIRRMWHKNIVQLRNYRGCRLICNGTGIIYENHIITAAHVVEDATKLISIRKQDLSSNSTENLELYHQINDCYSYEANLDYAVIDSEYDDYKEITINTNYKAGDKIYVIGFGEKNVGLHVSENDFYVTSGYIIGTGGLICDGTEIAHTAPVIHGDSGGAILNAKGDLIGVLKAKNKNFGKAVSCRNIIIDEEKQNISDIFYNEKLIYDNNNDFYYLSSIWNFDFWEGGCSIYPKDGFAIDTEDAVVYYKLELEVFLNDEKKSEEIIKNSYSNIKYSSIINAFYDEKIDNYDVIKVYFSIEKIEGKMILYH